METTTSEPSGGPAHTLGELVGARGARIHWGRAAAFLAGLIVADFWGVVRPLMQPLMQDDVSDRLAAHLIQMLVGELVLAAAVVVAYRWIRNDLAAAPAAAGGYAAIMLLVRLAIEAARSSDAVSPALDMNQLWQVAYGLSWTLFFLLGLSFFVPRVRQPWLGLGVGAVVGWLAGQVGGVLINLLREPRSSIWVTWELRQVVLLVSAAGLFAGAFSVGLRLAGLAPAARGRAPLQRPLIVWAVLGLGLVGSMALIQVIAKDRFGGDVENKTIGLLGALAFFSLTALAASLRIEKGYLVAAGWLGVVASAAGLALVLVAVVLDRPDLTVVKLLAVAAILAVAAALGSLVLLARGRSGAIDGLAAATFWLLSLSAAISCVPILSGEQPGRLLAKLIGVISVFGTVGLGVTPLLARLRRVRQRESSGGGPGAPAGTALETPLILGAAVGMSLLGVMALVQVVGEVRFGETENKLTAIFASVALFGLTALAAAGRLHREPLLAVGGVVASGVGLLLMVAAILPRRPDPTLGKGVGVAVTLALTAAFGSLVLLLRGRSRSIDVLVLSTASLLALSALVSIVTIVGEPREEWLETVLSVSLILSGVGLGATPLLARLHRLQEAQGG